MSIWQHSGCCTPSLLDCSTFRHGALESLHLNSGVLRTETVLSMEFLELYDRLTVYGIREKAIHTLALSHHAVTITGAARIDDARPPVAPCQGCRINTKITLP